jgi:hypothetical protein
MDFNDILVSLIAAVFLGLALWWILFRGGADRLDGSWLSIFLIGGIPKSSRGWNADSFKLLALAAFTAAVFYLLVKVVLYLVGE